MGFNIPYTDKKRVVIIGGGFGGLKLAEKLKKSKFQVVLIDKNKYMASIRKGIPFKPPSANWNMIIL